MKTPKKAFKTIDEYIATFPKNTQSILEEMRQTIRESAPKAEEAISYQMPYFQIERELGTFCGMEESYWVLWGWLLTY